MDEQIKAIIYKTVLDMLKESTSGSNITYMVEKHTKKIHFIPIRYRIIGGIIQGLNIKFGNLVV